MKNKRWRPWVLTVVILLAAGVAILLIVHRQPGDTDTSKPLVVRTAPIAAGDVPVYLDAVGTVTPFSTVTVRTQVQGTLASVAFKEGQVVRKGDLLATIDDRALRAQLDTAEGALARDRAQLANARRDLARMQAMVDIGSASRQQLDSQDTAVRQAEGVVKSDAGSVENLRVQLGYTRIVAPMDGVAGLRAVDAGNLVSPSDADGVVTLTSLSPTTVKFALPIDQVSQVVDARGEGAVDVEAFDRDGGKSLAKGGLEAIDNRVDQDTGTVMLRARFDDPNGVLFPNRFVSARIHVQTLRGAMTVPLAAIRHGSDGAYMFVVRDGKAHLQAVTLGPTQGEQGAISAKGLAAGTQVAVEGIDALEDGVDVRVAGQLPAGQQAR
ncbi:membrane fusion protein, multidrug efflux system [Pseudoxanthomonas sp. GM95]|uniref:efflux RND transporter periplasmic adaptor subunit n=1 Tax=Pseudoxanthomonas sp. GM95 TaxID=1881043 RepID=UPI0008B4983C|nr:efflux RND transporter periplasmic adaptor subunit [Pseudoxanthomonas sp. GM95]SEL08494.1 membrane fusion protein, multidrug efflux system [Pseudoxanthomonas sp. GM95]